VRQWKRKVDKVQVEELGLNVLERFLSKQRSEKMMT
jgi:hypothetical protein